MIVIGTAGHIDHGKSAIVKRLTGTDPDRLPEEKQRGMTIELGFAFMKAANGDEIAFVDVPGHERFVKNMIAGAGGIDSVMFVVAADDGWMPQSEEHFQIIRLLGLKHGLIIINKIDLVDAEWLELLESDIRQKVKGSFLESAPILRVSSITGEGFDRLTTYLDKVTTEIATRRGIGKTRLYIDRAFVRQGIGRVVAGTLRGGTLELGQEISVWPGNIHGRVKTIQSNNADVKIAAPGQRTAISLSGIDKELLRRGNVITDSENLDFYNKHSVLALSVELLSNSPVSLSDRREVTVTIGTTESTGEIRLLDQKIIKPGQSGIVFFRPEHPIYALVADHHIIRLPTPMVTLGGGLVLDHLERLPRKRESESLAYLKERVTADLEQIVVSELHKMIVASEDAFLIQADFSVEEIKASSRSLANSGKISKSGSVLIHPARFESEVTHLKTTIEKFLSDKPHVSGLDIDQLRRLMNLDSDTTNVLLDYLVKNGELVKVGERYSLAGRGMSLKGGVKRAHEQITNALNKQRFAPPRLSELAANGKEFREAIRYMIESGEGHKCGSEFLFLGSDWDEIIALVRERISADNCLTVADLKQAFGFSRKYAIPILEETDRIGITCREGDKRTRGKNFESTHADS